jgi:hypothetical protein
VDGLSTRELARREHLREGTVLTRVFVAKQRLREALRRSGGYLERNASPRTIELRPSVAKSAHPKRPGLPEPTDWER